MQVYNEYLDGFTGKISDGVRIGRPVPNNHLLELLNVAVKIEGSGVAERVNFFVYENGVKIHIGDGVAVVAGGVASWDGRIFVKEGSRIGVESPDVGAGKKCDVYISGILHNPKTWAKDGG